MKSNKITIVMIVLFFVGLSLLLYPIISNYYNQKVGARTIVDYEAMLNNRDDSEYEKMFDDALSYNKKIMKLDNPFVFHNTIKGYNKLLNFDNTGMIGYIKINKIKTELPIYHGTSKEVLTKGVGHLEGSSLPIGGTGTHSVLSAHRGLPSSTLFSNLDKLEIGDTFTIKVLNRELTYQVDNIQIVKPRDLSLLKIEKKRDYVTLMTCTPYGINTHRLLVRGVRVENIEKTFITTEAFRINKNTITLILLIPVILILLIVVMFKPIGVNKDKIKNKYIYPDQYKCKGKGDN